MIAWSYDAGELNPKEIQDAYILKKGFIEHYLNSASGAHERKLFLIGAKGSGKTLLLRYKAFKYWEKLNSDETRVYQDSESHELVESLFFDFGNLSQNELQQLSDHQNWIRIWNFAIALIIVRRTKLLTQENDTDELYKHFPSYFSLADIVNKLINYSKKYLFSDFLRCTNDLIARTRQIRRPFALFIDRLDQALNMVLQNDEYNYLVNEQGENSAFLVWRSAQFGLLVSIYNFNTAINSHLKIFATARNEALGVNSELRQNIINYSIQLSYSREELREIFINNINLTPKQHLSDPEHEDPFQKFFGFKEIEHIKARDPYNNPVLEKVFDFMCRHTFERPREIVKIGQKIYDSLLSKKALKKLSILEKIERVRRIVNDTSHDDILKDYLGEIVPGFKVEYLEAFARALNSNVITYEELQEVDSEIINYLYRIGLIGFVHGQKTQEFLEASRYIYSDKKIEKSDYYFLHPAVDRFLQEHITFQDFYTPFNIIGNGYQFYPPPAFNNAIWTTKELNYFIPLKVAGKSDAFKEGNKNFNINIPMEKLYVQFFSNDCQKEVREFKNKKFDEAFKMLSCIANYHFCKKLQSHFHEGFEEWEAVLNKKLYSFKGANNYGARIEGVSTVDLVNFGRRLIGRLLTVGLHVFLGLEYNVIQNTLKFYEFNADPDFIDENAGRYLRNAFFLSGLRKTPPQTEDGRSAILNSLSSFERDHLLKWWARYKNHELSPNGNLQLRHFEYLKENLFNI